MIANSMAGRPTSETTLAHDAATFGLQAREVGQLAGSVLAVAVMIHVKRVTV